ncbi:APC family permease [Rhodococcus fascians]|nr:APC family permease [Rhodococcus fascians]MBY3826614.1 APC family permease [Rhodococcus fascians]MBY3837075.1 APC family permease [Rhodococcus fascians]MBY3865458.1 APC family permease [Rhodococcus fascians]MBY3885756.1 APC family permease [Rhodococcus fascians]
MPEIPNSPVAADARSGPPLGVSGTYDRELARSLGVSGNVMLTLSSISPAASVFILGGAALTAYGTGVFWGFLIGGIISLLIALCYAELGSRHPVAGGDYAMVSRTLGPASGVAVFFLGLVGLPLAQAIFALGVADYLGVAISGVDPLVTALVVTLIATVVACLNIRTNAWVTGSFLFVEMASLVLLTALGLVHIERPITDLLNPQALDSSGALAPIGIAGLVLVVTQGVLSQFGYGGAVYFAEETKNPRRNVARAVLYSALITVVVELVPLVSVMLGADSIEGLVGSDLPVQEFLEQRAGHAVAVFVLLTMALAILNANIALGLQAGRLLFAAARDQALPAVLATPLSRVSGSVSMPRVATIVMGVISGACCLMPMTLLVNATGSTVVVGFAFIALSALVVRRQRGVEHPELFRMPLWPLPALVALIVIVGIVVIGVMDPQQWLSLGIALGIVAAGYAYYFGYLRSRGATHLLLLDAQDDDRV